MTVEIIENKPALNIYQRLLHIMSELDYIQKGEKTVNGQYRFVSHDQVTAKVHPYLVKHGVLALPTTKSITQEGNRTHVELIVYFINVDNPGDQFPVTFHGYGVDSGDKGPGKAVSYAFKYALLKVLCLETGEDSDNDANASYEPGKCLEFEGIIPPDGNLERLNQFLLHCADASGLHLEDMKREALTKIDSFLSAYMKWKPKKTTKEIKT